MKFKVSVGGAIKYDETDLIQCTEFQDNYDYKFPEPYQLPANSAFALTVKLAKDWASNTEVLTFCYRAKGGLENGSEKNYHKGIFKVKNGQDSTNGTNVT